MPLYGDVSSTQLSSNNATNIAFNPVVNVGSGIVSPENDTYQTQPQTQSPYADPGDTLDVQAKLRGTYGQDSTEDYSSMAKSTEDSTTPAKTITTGMADIGSFFTNSGINPLWIAGGLAAILIIYMLFNQKGKNNHE